MAAWDQTISDLAPGPRGPEAVSQEEVERLTAQGVPRALVAPIVIQFERHDLARLLEFIEQRAVRSENYIDVRQAVLFSEMLREQARKQGF